MLYRKDIGIKMNLQEKKYLVAGAGISGIGAVRLITALGAEVVLYDGNEKLAEEQLIEKMRIAGVREPEEINIVLGELTRSVAETIDICVISPGISMEVPFVRLLKELGKTIWGEIELAYRCMRGMLIGITGTNGKTTTTALTGAIMEKYCGNAYVVGNIGTPYTLMVSKANDESITVAEISSFQLETIDEFQPDVSAVLNITPDHLNRHHNMKCYGDVKISICKNQTENQVCVLNYEDEMLREYAKGLRCRVVFFSSRRELESGIYLDKNGGIYISEKGSRKLLLNISSMKLVGIHNAENVMAAIAISEAVGVPSDLYVEVIKGFDAIEHRIEYVDTIDGVIYYNDSKGTNTDASKKALEAMERKTVLIAGGYDKGSEYDDWVEAFGDKIKCLVLLGATKEKIADTAKKHGFTNIIMVESLKEAVRKAAENAKAGETVLLSPACASWDMFKSYEERGRLFKDFVRALKE